ncbi:MAG TPA: TonB-dependent receptor, partial [Polyangia bacterium]|nr:TonB-dependent receptor [Polyangia bacterium]
MNRICGGAILVGCALLLFAGVARAQDVTGKVIGQVLDKDTGNPLGGITVIVQGPQGEDGTITDNRGNYYFPSLPIGKYVIRFYLGNMASQVEQPNVIVSAQKTVRVNARIAGTAQASPEQTYVIRGKPPAVDVGSTRLGPSFDEDYTRYVPVGRTFGDVIEKAPGAFIDRSGGVSIGGASALENIYVINGLNTTGMEYGNLDTGSASLGGGTNLPLEFISQIDVNSGGYAAEFGGAMGGVINVVTKSGTNELKGSVFGYWSPYWLSAEPSTVTRVGGALGALRKPDFDTNIGVEVGGPIIRNKLFFWVGFAPRVNNSHVFRNTYAQQDANGDGMADLDASGNPITKELRDWRARIPESRQTYSYAGTLDFTPTPDHRLTLYVLGTPSVNKQMRIFNNIEHVSNPDWARQSIDKNKTDVTARWTSKLFDRRWIIEANAGLHREDYSEGSAISALNGLNQLEHWGANLWDLEKAPGCQPYANGFQPCPVDNYHNGGYGQVKKYTGTRWMGELKSTNLLEAGGHHEIKYGYHVELNQFDLNRYYSGPLGARALIQEYPTSTNAWYFFSLQQGDYPANF